MTSAPNSWGLISADDRELLIDTIKLFAEGRFDECAAKIALLIGSGFGTNEYLERLQIAVARQQWELISDDFDSGRFVGTDGRFLLVGPYTRARRRRRESRNSGLAGVALFDESQLDLSKASSAIFGRDPHPTNRIIGVTHFTSCGLVGGANGEAFLVPNGWAFGQSTSGPAINLLIDQYHRICEGVSRLADVFDEQSHAWLAEAAMSFTDGIVRRNSEFQFHENGHATGLGFRCKAENGFFLTLEHCGVEEWRSDGVSFRLAGINGGREVADSVAASCVALRLGVDARRKGGTARDQDALTAALMISDMLDSGAIGRNTHGRLHVETDGYSGASALVSAQTSRAVELTKRENRVSIDQLPELYGEIKPTEQAVRIVDELSA